jgi:site-specific recombinase XerC
VRSGKGDVYREIPLNRPCRDAVDEWTTQRSSVVEERERALFIGPRGGRLTPRSAAWCAASRAGQGSLAEVGDRADPYWRLVSAFLVGYPPHSSRAYFSDLRAWQA